MMGEVVHRASGWLGYQPLCGIGDGMLQTPKVAKQKSKVSCKNCLKKMEAK